MATDTEAGALESQQPPPVDLENPSEPSDDSSPASQTAGAAPAADTDGKRQQPAPNPNRYPYPSWAEYDKWGERKAVGFGRLAWVGLRLLNAMDFIGEVVADFFGITDSRYQYVVDAYERHMWEVQQEKAEEEAALAALEKKRQEAVEAEVAEPVAEAAAVAVASDTMASSRGIPSLTVTAPGPDTAPVGAAGTMV